MNGELPEGLAEKARIKLATDAAAEVASRVPIAGNEREAFKKPQSISVLAGEKTYNVRPVYDLDFSILQGLKHPLCEMAISGENWFNSVSKLRGNPGWVACWILTHSIDEADSAAEAGTIEKQAKEEFGKNFQIGELLQILEKVGEQYERYFSTMVSFNSGEDAPEEGEKKSAVTIQNSGGSPTSVAS